MRAKRPPLEALAIRDAPLLLPAEDLLVHELIDAPDHRFPPLFTAGARPFAGTTREATKLSPPE